MKNRRLLFFLLLFVSFEVFAANICVISLLGPKSREGRMVTSVFKYDKNVIVLDRPEISEIERCFQGDFNEVVWVSHSVELGIRKKYMAPVHISTKGVKTPLYRRFFEKIAKKIPLIDSIKFRVAFCGVGDKNLTSMDPLTKAIKRNGGTLDLSKKSIIASFISRKSVTNLSMRWLAKSADKYTFKKWRTEDNGYCTEEHEYYYDGCIRSGSYDVVPVL